MLVSRLLFLVVLRFVSGCLGLENQAFDTGIITEINFRRSWISYVTRFHFLWCWVALGPICMTSVALETG